MGQWQPPAQAPQLIYNNPQAGAQMYPGYGQPQQPQQAAYAPQQYYQQPAAAP